jgi:hypothetical protein
MPSKTEGRIALALQAYNNNHFTSLRATAETYEVPFETLRTRHLGVLPRAAIPANSRKFTNDEEQILLRKILQLSADGFPPQRAIVEEMANTMLDTKNPASPQKVGTKWVANFVKRHPELSSVYNRKFDIQRAEVEDPEIIGKWFKLVGDTIAKYGVLEEDIFNFDETGFQMGVISTSKVITTSDRKGRPRTKQPGNRKWVTVIEAISARGQAIPPFIIFDGKLHQATWYQTGIPTTWRIAVSDNGWTNNELGLEWIQHFHEYTKKCKGKWRLLIFDGHGSHQTAKFRDFCLQNCILTLCMPAHTSHILQPLDVSCFSPLKKVYGSQIEMKMRLGINHITKEEFLPAFLTAHRQVITTETITSGFKATGLVPFDPQRVLDKLGPIIKATPSPRSSQTSWNPQTPKTLPQIKRQGQLVLTENRKRRRLSASSADKPFQQLLRGFENVVHEKAILIAENAALRAENQHQKKKRVRKTGSIQKGGSIAVDDAQEAIQGRRVREQSDDNNEDEEPASTSWPPRRATKMSLPRCSGCGKVGHSVKFCSL